MKRFLYASGVFLIMLTTGMKPVEGPVNWMTFEEAIEK
jgi:hypothetical protein